MTPETLKQTPLTHLHQSKDAKMIDYAGYLMPIEYVGVSKEHMAVREKAGLFDVSHMGELWIKGEKALEFLQYTTVNDISKILPGKAQYNCIINEQGGILDDVIVYHYAENEYLLVVNAINIEKDYAWLKEINNSPKLKIENASDEFSLIALQGPKADTILAPLIDCDLGSLKSFSFIKNKVGNISDVIVSRTGYTGSGGVELYVKSNDAAQLWCNILESGYKYGLQEAGLAARDTLRIEKGYCLYGNEIDENTTPFQAGLNWVVKTKNKSDFIAKDIFSVSSTLKPDRITTGIKLIDRGIPRKGYKIFHGSNIIGVVTSGTMSPMLKKGIGIIRIDKQFAHVGNEVYIQVRNKMIKAQITNLPFI